ncbi:MAG: type II toxin-antitoxin system VapC family toxin [Candidatus Dormibacteraceae bacterium]
MSISSLERAIPAGSRILLDSSTLIAYLNGGEAASDAATHVVDSLVRSGRNVAVISMVTVIEILIRPLRRAPEHYHHVLDFVTHFPNFQPQPIDLAAAQEAAGVRARQGLPTSDAIVVATGLTAQVACLVTNDDRWRSIRDLRIKVVCLEDHLPLT